MSVRFWVLFKYQNKYHPTWCNYKVESKTSWQKIAAHQKAHPNNGLTYTWIAESEDKAMLEAMKKLVEQT